MTIKDIKLNIAIKIFLEIIPEEITTNPSKNNSITGTLKILIKFCISKAIKSVPPVAQSLFKAIPIADPTRRPPIIEAIISSNIPLILAINFVI